MASLQQINEKGKETIVKTINRISLTIALLSGLSAIFYLFVQLYLPAILVSIVGFLFLVTYFLNKKEFHALARIISIVATNVGVLLFSSYLGFNSGFYLYLFASPQLIYLLFRIRQKKLIYFCIGINLLTFSSIFIIDAYNIVQSALIDLKILHLLYSLNFFFSIIICFVLIAIFARNNKIYIELLKDVNLQLENQQKKLIIEIAEKNNINVDLQKSIKEKDILLAEVHHRVKNNLAVISGLIDLQNVFVKEKVISDILKDSKNRIKSIALLHEKLYAHKDLNKIDLKTYISELLHFIKISYTIQSKEIDIISEIENVELSMESALPFSLLVNELITNSYKYAFNSMEKGSIFISITECDGLLELVYKDDGIGFDFEKTLQNNSIGTNLINAFAFQLNSDFINNTAVNKGCEIILRFRDL